jgi:hypothetical protein
MSTKKVPGMEEAHKSLSEYAHPNWKGVMMLYSNIDRGKHVIYFGRGLKPQENIAGSISSAMLASMLLFELLYNKISDGMPAYLKGLEQL